VNHRWYHIEDGYWRCALCEEVSPTRRRPRSDGCTGPVFSEKELLSWRWETERVDNGGLNLYLVSGTVKILIRHCGVEHEITAAFVEQYVALTKEIE
jgi:hypothetical protein